jgi:hypothetical protein
MTRTFARRSAFAAGILSLVAIPVVAGAAYAGTADHPHTTTIKKTAATTLTTRVPNAEIRRRATTVHSKVLKTVRTSGTDVKVSCYVIGASVGGDKTWYRTTAPAHGYGYIAGNQLTIANEPATGVAKCSRKH